MPIAGPGGAPPASGIAPTLGSQPGAPPAAVEIRARLDAMRERRLAFEEAKRAGTSPAATTAQPAPPAPLPLE
mgnify:CR=1 FL=1